MKIFTGARPYLRQPIVLQDTWNSLSERIFPELPAGPDQ
jgi:hypothetical protein